MTKKQFDNYRFSIKTRVLFEGEWEPIETVWFDDRTVSLKKRFDIISFKQIQAIKEAK